VTKALWDQVYQWAVTNGYAFNYNTQCADGVSPRNNN
jgi:hypothetical protein